MKATLKDMLSNQFRDAKEDAYHLEQSHNYMENQVVWESRQKDLKRPQPGALVFYGPLRNPNEPPRYLYNKDLFYLKYGNTKKKKYVLSLHKIHVILFPEEDLEERLKRWELKSSKSSESKPDVGNGGADGVAQVRIRGGGWLLILVVRMRSICCYHLDLILIRIRLEAVEDVRQWSFDDL
ncbi:hypothetical protein Tco_0535243 [Tanacetum coccineum]